MLNGIPRVTTIIKQIKKKKTLLAEQYVKYQ